MTTKKPTSKPKSRVASSSIAGQKKYNSTLVLLIILALVLIGYLLVKLSFAAGSGPSPISQPAKGVPKYTGCQGVTSYREISAGVFCENGTTVNKRTTVNTGSKTPPKSVSCQGVTSYREISSGVFCENGTTVNSRTTKNPGTKS